MNFVYFSVRLSKNVTRLDVAEYLQVKWKLYLMEIKYTNKKSQRCNVVSWKTDRIMLMASPRGYFTARLATDLVYI